MSEGSSKLGTETLPEVSEAEAAAQRLAAAQARLTDSTLNEGKSDVAKTGRLAEDSTPINASIINARKSNVAKARRLADARNQSTPRPAADIDGVLRDIDVALRKSQPLRHVEEESYNLADVPPELRVFAKQGLVSLSSMPHSSESSEEARRWVVELAKIRNEERRYKIRQRQWFVRIGLGVCLFASGIFMALHGMPDVGISLIGAGTGTVVGKVPNASKKSEEKDDVKADA